MSTFFRRYVYTAHWVGLGWPKPSNGPWAPCILCYAIRTGNVLISLEQRGTHTHPPVSGGKFQPALPTLFFLQSLTQCQYERLVFLVKQQTGGHEQMPSMLEKSNIFFVFEHVEVF